jgi:nicotinamide-nucleotide adenylyltransferase
MSKKYKTGLILGRFQPIHNGHLSIIYRALDECDKVIIVIGSAQESGTKKNPFDITQRIELIRRSLRSKMEKIDIFPLEDRKEIAADSTWGEYVFEKLEQAGLNRPDAVYVGGGENREDWWDSTGADIITTDRNITPISSTMLRQFIIDDNSDRFTDLTHPHIWIKYNLLRKILLEIKNDMYEIEVCINGKKEIYMHEATEDEPIELFITKFMENHIGEDISMFKVTKKGR